MNLFTSNWRKWIVGAALLSTTIAPATLDEMRSRVPKIVELKEKGAIGEQWDGLLGVVAGGGEASAVVEAENRDRREIYADRARKSSPPVSTEDFMKVMGAERITKEPAGRAVKKGPSAGWSKK